MLHSDLDPRVKSDRIREMPAVRNLVWRHLSFVDDRPGKREGIFLHAPALAEIVLSTCTVHRRRPSVVVDEDHIVTLAPPRTLEVVHRVITAYVCTCACCFQDCIVALTVEVGNHRFERICLKILGGPALCGVLPFPGCMEEQCTVRMWLSLQFIVDVEILEVRNVILVLNFDTGARIEGPVA